MAAGEGFLEAMYPAPMESADPNAPAPDKSEFPCEQCGAKLKFKPGAEKLTCEYCGHEQHIPQVQAGPPREYDFHEALARMRRAPATALDQQAREIRCTFCGAVSVTAKQSDHCAFCGSPVVIAEVSADVIVPETVLPFAIDNRGARERFDNWLKGLWFAPNDLQKRARASGMDGVYLPYWTYDTSTGTHYVGQRGDHYYVTESYTDSEGKRQTRQVRKTRWRWTSGHVAMSFDDVLVCGSKSLPRWLLDGLEPWDLHDLKPFEPSYLSGFAAERFGVDLQSGFEIAKQRMDRDIENAIERDIGGDEQRIFNKNTDWGSPTFKLVLLPLWISSFRYQEKIYRFVVNARTGAIQGERPWSTAKIVATVIGVIALIVGIVLAINYFGK
jgi:hypothetical protein